jgi:hypothetical protein
MHRWVEKLGEQKNAVCRDCGKERVLDTLNPPPGAYHP